MDYCFIMKKQSNSLRTSTMVLSYACHLWYFRVVGRLFLVRLFSGNLILTVKIAL
jgi:hypothetical protein